MTHVVERVFDAPEEMAATAGRLSAASNGPWHGRMRCLQVDGVRADYVELDPYRLEVPPLEQRPPDPDRPVQMMLSIILTGSSTGIVGGQALTLSSTQAAILDGRAAMRFESLTPVRAVRLFVDEDELSPQTLAHPGLPFVRLKHTPLVTGCIGLITGLLQVSSPRVRRHDESHVARPLIAVMASLLDQALQDPDSAGQHDVSTAQHSQSRRGQIEAYIDQHLTSGDLGVQSIAQALDVHIRTVHAAFKDNDKTVTALIRSRRVQRAQALAVLRDHPPNTRALAEQVGLTPEQLTRAFQRQTGLTARQWWQHHQQRRHVSKKISRPTDAASSA